MKFAMKASTLLTLLCMAIANGIAVAIDHLDSPELVWQTQADVILDGNGVFISPDDSITVVAQANGNLNAYDTFSGQDLWMFVPPGNNDLPIACQGGVTFSATGGQDYLIYSIVDDPNGIISFT